MRKLHNDLIELPTAGAETTHQVVTETLGGEGGGKKIQDKHNEGLERSQTLVTRLTGN